MTDPTSGRVPDDFDGMYEAGTPPWDIGRPQPAVVDTERQGGFSGRILDIGCGSGENALFLAEKGYDVVGVDLSRHALRAADRKAEERGLTVPFHLMDALKLEPGRLGGRFDTLLDSGVFHIFTDEERLLYVSGLARVAKTGTLYHMLVFSDREPTDWGGPRRIDEDEIHQTFRTGWQILQIAPTRFATMIGVTGHAWHATIRRR